MANRKWCFVLLLITQLSYGQGRIWKETTKPVTPKTNFSITKDFILTNDSTFMWVSNKWQYRAVAPQGRSGADGKDGKDGINGSGGVNGFIEPDKYGASHSNSLIPNQQWIDSLIPNIGATTSWTKDRGAITYCLQKANGRIIVMYGNYYVENSLKRPKYADVNIIANAVVYTTNSNTFSVFTSDEATSLADAETMEGYTVSIEGLSLSLQGQQTGYDLNPCFMARLIKCNSYGGLTGFNLEFCLIPKLDQCRAQNCTNGLILTYSGVAGGGISTSESNAGEINSFRTHTVSGVGIWLNDVYETTITNYVCEGNGSIVNAVKITSAGTTDKSTTINGFHFEQTGGCTDALFKINTRDMDVLISNPIAHYGGLLIDATSSTGQGIVTLARCGYAVGINNKYFKMSNITGHFSRNNYFPSVAVINNCFVDGFALGLCSGTGCGTNKYTIDIIGR